MSRITITGAGLAGTLLAIALARRGYDVDLYERRPDVRLGRIEHGRSINLALSARGSHALSQIGILDRVLANGVPMRARAIHSVTGDVAYQPFGRNDGEYLSAIERQTLNILLLDAAAEYPNIRIVFDCRLVGIDFETMTLTTAGTSQAVQERKCDRLIAADGAFSAARAIMVEKGLAQFTLDELAYGYKEFPITTENARQMRLECLHLWPRRSFLMIANPNPDASFSCTLFLPHEGGDASFAALATARDVDAFFRAHFRDAFDLMPELTSHFFSVPDSEASSGQRRRPTGTLPTVKGGPWHVEDKVLLLGDAAHALVPFFAQGMNSAFEDCSILLDCLERSGDRWDVAVPEFFARRKVDTDAIAELAMQNYREIQDYIADDRFLLRKRIEQEIMRRFPDLYTSMHILVMFTRAPYAYAKSCGALQTRLLDDICLGITRIDDLDWARVGGLLAKYAEDVRALAKGS